jgi:hypothetical protein
MENNILSKAYRMPAPPVQRQAEEYFNIVKFNVITPLGTIKPIIFCVFYFYQGGY